MLGKIITASADSSPSDCLCSGWISRCPSGWLPLSPSARHGTHTPAAEGPRVRLSDWGLRLPGACSSCDRGPSQFRASGSVWSESSWLLVSRTLPRASCWRAPSLCFFCCTIARFLSSSFRFPLAVSCAAPTLFLYSGSFSSSPPPSPASSLSSLPSSLTAWAQIFWRHVGSFRSTPF